MESIVTLAWLEDRYLILSFLTLAALYLSGHFLGSRLTRKGDGLAELLLIRVSVAAAISGPLLIALALLGWFKAPVIAGAVGTLAGGTWMISRKQPEFARFQGWDFAALGLSIAGFILYARPAEYVINDRDPGVYTIVAAHLARTGQLLTQDPLVGAVTSFHQFNAWTKYPGFYIYGNDLVVPQFFPGTFAWLGVGNIAGGVWGELYVVPVFGALAAGAAFMLGKELFGRWTGLLGASILAVSYAQVWWARQPSSEVITQFFILSGLWLAARFVKIKGGTGVVGYRAAGAGTGVLAGALLGGAALVRIDAFLAWAPILLLIGYDLLLRRPVRRWIWLVLPLAIFGTAALLYANTIGGRYLNLIYRKHGLKDALELSPYLLGATVLTALVFWAVYRRWREGFTRWIQAHSSNLAVLGALVVVGAALWAYFYLLQPWDSLPDGAAGFNAYDRQVAVRMVWFLTPAVAVLGMAGFVLAAYRITVARVLLLGSVLSFGVLYVALPNVAPDLPWATRRFVPAVFPGFSLLAGYAIVESGVFLKKVWGLRAGTALSGILAAMVLVWTGYTALPVLKIQELSGAVSSFNRVNQAIPPARVVYVELPGAFDHYGSTLEYLYGRPVLAYDKKLFREEIPNLKQAGLLKDAIYITVDGSPAPAFPGLKLHQLSVEEVSLPRLAPRFKSLPDSTYNLRAAFRVYRIEEL